MGHFTFGVLLWVFAVFWLALQVQWHNTFGMVVSGCSVLLITVLLGTQLVRR